MRSSNERGVALITTLLVMMLMMALLVGFTAVVTSDQRYRFIDKDRNQAFYGAAAGIEKQTGDLGQLFLSHVAPSYSELAGITTTSSKPVIDKVTYIAPIDAEVMPTSSLTKCASPNTIGSVGSAGYTFKFCSAPSGNPTTTTTAPIKTGPYEGLVALQMPFQLDVSAKTSTGGEVHLVRTMEAVAIPVFQFGIFSDVDLSFFAGPNFNFGGRVHTNGSLFLAEGNGNTLTLTDKVTAVKEIIRQRMQNGASIDDAPAHAGTISMAMSPTAFRPLLRTEGSLVDGIGSAFNEPTWHATSLSSYNSWIRNGRTGTKALNLALITVGGSNPDMVRRPVANENSTNPLLLAERMFVKASLRILLSDIATDITGLPTVTSTSAVQLDGNWRTTPPNNGTPYNGGAGVNATHPPVARSRGNVGAVISVGANASGTAPVVLRNLTMLAALPADYQVPANLTAVKTGAGAGTWNLTGCNLQKTTQTFTCTGGHAATTTAAGATISGNINTADGVIVVQTTTTGTWTNNGAIPVVSTMAFAQESFFVNGDVVSCGGYDTNATRLTGCNLPSNIANNTSLTNGFMTPQGTGSLGGFIKIERGNADGTWTDVTMEILNYGIGAPNLGGVACGDPTPNAIIRLERLRDNTFRDAAGAAAWPGGVCPYAASANTVSTDYWPNVLFDTREALMRDTAGVNLPLGGVMHYVQIDVQNLAQWFRSTGAFAGGTGSLSKTDNAGFTVYFSDRRNNRDAAGRETGEYGYEDFVNPLSGTGAPNNSLDAGEDVNANNALDSYGGTPSYNGVNSSVVPGSTGAFNATATTPLTTVPADQARVNRALFFRRALKLTNGTNIAATGVTGLTVVAENPIYVQGDWNAQGGGWTGQTAATAVIGDAVTLLSNGWNDNTSFLQPYTVGNRNRGTQTWYRLAIISGKGMSFPQPGGTSSDFGTDGGAHNFLRYLENGDQAVNYRGSIATFFYNRQGVGTYKCCNTVYGAPGRNYTFDTNFLNPALLPPNTPMFRDLNAVGFAQEMRPGR